MGSLDNPLLHCSTIRDLLKRIDRIHGELIEHENTLPKCEICWENHHEFTSMQSQLLLLLLNCNFHRGNDIQGTSSSDHTYHTQEIPPFDPLASMSFKEEDTRINIQDSSTYQSDKDHDDIQSTQSCTTEDANEFTDEDTAEMPKKKRVKKEKCPCPICGINFFPGNKFTIHYNKCQKKSVTKETSFSKFQCAHCSIVFFTKIQMRIHMRIHKKPVRTPKDTGNAELICKICKKGYTTLQGLKKHEKLHEKQKDYEYKCGICTRYFYNATMLERHMEFRSRANLLCDICNSKFCTNTDFQHHQRVVHKINTSFNCNYCVEEFKNFRLLFRHHKQEHPAKEIPASPYLCEMCGIVMMDQRDLSFHVRSIHESQQFKCDTCRKTFPGQKELDTHKRIHIPISQLEDPYMCDKCPKKFRTKLTLDRHQRFHTGEVTEMFCTVCNRRFIRAERLEEHMQKHENEAPRSLKCEVCGKAFTRLKYMNQHRKTEHNIFTHLMLNPKSKKNP